MDGQIWVWALIGLITGSTFAITGAGGALVSVPLFLYLAGISLQDATRYALFAVFAGSLLNWIVQRRETVPKVSAMLFVFSVATSFCVARIKSGIPDWVVKLIYTAVCAFALRGIFVKRGFHKTQTAAAPEWGAKYYALVAMSGAVQGAVMTITGLGGALILIPLLLGPLGLPPNQAVSTNLLTIALTSLGSIASQFDAFRGHFDPLLVCALVAAIFLAATGWGKILSRLTEARLGRLRTTVFTTLIVLSVILLLLKGGG